MRIECLTTFMDGADRFEAGDTRTVEDERGQRFIGHGWAKVPGTPSPAPVPHSDVVLAVQDGFIGMTSNG